MNNEDVLDQVHEIGQRIEREIKAAIQEVVAAEVKGKGRNSHIVLIAAEAASSVVTQGLNQVNLGFFSYNGAPQAAIDAYKLYIEQIKEGATQEGAKLFKETIKEWEGIKEEH